MSRKAITDAATASIRSSRCGLANGMKKDGMMSLSYGARDGRKEGAEEEMTKTIDNMSYIDLVFKGICKGCRQADLELLSAESYFEEKFWAVRCNHARACEAAWEKALREAERRTDDE